METIKILLIQLGILQNGIPYFIKPNAGGGGRGLRRVDHPEEFEDSLKLSKSER